MVAWDRRGMWMMADGRAGNCAITAASSIMTTSLRATRHSSGPVWIPRPSAVAAPFRERRPGSNSPTSARILHGLNNSRSGSRPTGSSSLPVKTIPPLKRSPSPGGASTSSHSPSLAAIKPTGWGATSMPKICSKKSRPGLTIPFSETCWWKPSSAAIATSRGSAFLRVFSTSRAVLEYLNWRSRR